MDQGAIAVSLIASSLILNVPVGSAECGLHYWQEREALLPVARFWWRLAPPKPLNEKGARSELN
jgi:hypothetical protein